MFNNKIPIQTLNSEFPDIIPGCEYFFLIGIPCFFRKSLISNPKLNVQLHLAKAKLELYLEKDMFDDMNNNYVNNIKKQIKQLQETICNECVYKKI